jgi:hypothetical protein
VSGDPSEARAEPRREAERPRATLYRVWAIVASLLCVALVAYIAISKIEESRSAELRRVALAADAARVPQASTGPDAANGVSGPAPAAPVADALAESGLAGLEREWITASDDTSLVGHAILIDLVRRRELIVERCRHVGHFDDDRREATVDVFPCETLVSGRIATIEDGSLIVLDSAGEAHQIPIEAAGTGDDARLTLTLEGDPIPLEPGSKNDLLQRFEGRPEIQLSKERAIQFELDQVEEARRRREASAP